MSHKSDNIELREILNKWEGIQGFLDTVLSCNTTSEYRIRDSVALYMIKKLEKYSLEELDIQNDALYSPEDYSVTDEKMLKEVTKLSKEWTNVYNALSDTKNICADLSQEMEKLEKITE